MMEYTRSTQKRIISVCSLQKCPLRCPYSGAFKVLQQDVKQCPMRCLCNGVNLRFCMGALVVNKKVGKVPFRVEEKTWEKNMAP